MSFYLIWDGRRSCEAMPGERGSRWGAGIDVEGHLSRVMKPEAFGLCRWLQIMGERDIAEQSR